MHPFTIVHTRLRAALYRRSKGPVFSKSSSVAGDVGNVLRMIRDVNGVPLAAVIRKRLIPPPDNEDMDFGPRQSKYISHDNEMIERAPILDSKEYDRTATDEYLEKTGPFDPR